MSTPTFHVVLVEPEIPPNTGNIGRLCVAAGARLHLVKPLGFSLDDRARQRAGLDYWEHLDWQLWDSWEQFESSLTPGHLGTAGRRASFHLLTTKTGRPFWDSVIHPGDFLIFGRETKGLPASLLAAHPDRCLTIPMRPEARSLNLATAVAIVLYEALRQARS